MYVLKTYPISAEIHEARVLEWHCVEDEEVRSGQLLVELEAQKSILEIRAGQSGVLRKILIPELRWVRLGEALALLSDDRHEKLPDRFDDLSEFSGEFELV